MLVLWTTSGLLEARGFQLMWVWTTQVLLLLLVVPVVLLTAQPVALTRAAYGPQAGLLRVLRSRPVRWAGHPALSLLYVPIANWLLFFGGVGDFTLRSAAAGWVLHVVLLVLGAVIALPLLDIEDDRTSLAVGLTVAIATVELLLDAIPGIVLRLETHLQISRFGMPRPPWSPSWLADQQTAGAILWTVAELLDMPFLILTIRQWIRIEQREARSSTPSWTGTRLPGRLAVTTVSPPSQAAPGGSLTRSCAAATAAVTEPPPVPSRAGQRASAGSRCRSLAKTPQSRS